MYLIITVCIHDIILPFQLVFSQDKSLSKLKLQINWRQEVSDILSLKNQRFEPPKNHTISSSIHLHLRVLNVNFPRGEWLPGSCEAVSLRDGTYIVFLSKWLGFFFVQKKTHVFRIFVGTPDSFGDFIG